MNHPCDFRLVNALKSYFSLWKVGRIVKLKSVQLILVICGFCLCDFTYLVKFICNPQINISSVNGLLGMWALTEWRKISVS